MNPGKKNSNLLKNTGIHFLEFALGFLSLAKCHYQPSHDMKVLRNAVWSSGSMIQPTAAASTSASAIPAVR